MVEPGIQKEADPAGDLLSRLAEQIGARASAKMVYGEPVERDGVTVIPVARARWGFGGGAGRGGPGGATGGGSGGGGGGGMVVSPLGYIELRGGESRFRRIVDVTPVGSFLLGLLCAWLFWGQWRRS